MQIITVKHFPTSNTKPSRFQATTSSGLKGPVISAYVLGADDMRLNALLCAQQLAITLNWKGTWVGGEVGGTNLNMVFVCADLQLSANFTV